MQTILAPEKSFSLLKKHSVPYAKYIIAKNKCSALKAAKQIGFPVVLKAFSKKIIHKSDAGAVKTNIQDEQGLESAFDWIMRNVKRKLHIKPEGIIVQKMEKGTEVIIGLKKDPQFGPVVMFGLGGIFVEILKDVSLRIAPLTKDDCFSMIDEIKGSEILKGARGKKPVNIGALVRILMKVSKMGIEKKNIAEMDLNPVIVDEKSVKVVDARIVVDASIIAEK